MSLEAWIALACFGGFVGFGALYRRAPDRILYRDEEGDGVSVRSICGWSSLICLVVAVALGVRWLGR